MKNNILYNILFKNKVWKQLRYMNSDDQSLPYILHTVSKMNLKSFTVNEGNDCV